ncbi:hypothetical protein RP20_CCG025860 [Aedes albopictus]|nr:hypothetical protein RP20_CCG025860 [Aedes albopictus]
MDAPSMVQRDGDKLIVRRVVSGDEVFLNQLDSPSSASSSKDQHQSSASNQSLADSLKIYPGEEDLSKFGLILEDSSGGQKGASSETGDSTEQQLPQCKIKRNYSCSNCTYFTQNPRKYLTHLRDVHGEKIIINECKRCLYASRHYQKLVRHMKMVHGSTDGIKTPFSSRRRGTFRKEYFKKNKFKMNTNESDFYNQNRASYLEQLNKMLRGAAGGGTGGESASDNQIYLDLNGDKSLQHQCIFCQIMVRTTDDLALHLRTFHSEELFALLLQKKPEDSGQPELQSYTAESLTIDIWKRLLENNKAILEEQESRENDSEMQSGQYSNDEDDAETVESAISKNETYLGVETAPGYGEVTSKYNIDDGPTQTSVMKKVFKCPHCSFWASTASRFHVHIVGHLNKKPFECSLCSYRSNWRWDITKHIRLKTIRDPSHKNAGVLMNDETGRRNYTKYNRYITLMKVTDNNYKDSSSSSKSMMETSQADYLAMCKAGDSPASLNSLAKMYSSEELAQAFNLASMNQMARFEPEMLQSLVGLPPKPLPTEDAKSSPQKAYKCKKCNFKNPFRELVLLHIRSTHMAIDKSSSAEAELDLLPCDQDQDVEPIETGPTAANSTLNPQSPLRPSLSPLSVVVSPRSESGNIGGLTGASPSASTTPSRHCRLKHNGNVLIEMVNNSSAKQSQNVTDTRNLKKVRKPFQSFDSVSQDIPVQPVTLHPIELVPEVSLIVQDVPLLQPPPLALIPFENTNINAVPPNVTIAPRIRTRTPPMTMTFINLTDDSSLEPPSSLPTPMQTDSAPTSDATAEEFYEEPMATHRMKRYQCDACPYETDSKTQFAYHKSFHKPRGDPYKCNICSYNVTKKHLLIQHQKTHAERSGPSASSSSHHITKPKVKPSVPAPVGIGELSIVMGNETKSTGLTPADILDLTKKIRDEVSITPAGGTPTLSDTITIDEKIVYYCAYCPARYLDESEIVIHQNRHTQEEKYKCDLCSFSTCDESGVTTHRNVHSANYRRGTRELRKLNMESDTHPRRRLVQIGDAVEKLWVVQDDYERLHSMQVESPEPEPEVPQRRSTRSMNNSPSITAAVTEITKEPKVYSCEHCDYTDSSECSFKDHVKFHFAAILFPKVNKYASLDKSGEPFRLIATSKADPQDSFELNYDSEEAVKVGVGSECNSTDRIIIEI